MLETKLDQIIEKLKVIPGEAALIELQEEIFRNNLDGETQIILPENLEKAAHIIRQAQIQELTKKPRKSKKDTEDKIERPKRYMSEEQMANFDAEGL